MTEHLQKKADEMAEHYYNSPSNYTVRDIILEAINEGICIGVESVFEKGEYFVSIDASQNPSESTCWGYKNKRLRALLAGKERDGQNGGGETVLQEVKRLLQVGSQPSVGSTPTVVSPETSKDEFDEFWNQPDCKHNELF